VAKSEQDGHMLWTAVWAKGTGEIGRETQTKHNGALLLRTIRQLTTTNAEPTPSDISGYTKISSGVAFADGHYLWTLAYAQGGGLIDRRTEDFGGGLQIVTSEILVANGGDPASYLPTGVRLPSRVAEGDGFDRWSIPVIQTYAGELPTTGTPLTYDTKHEFTYPGRAKPVALDATAAGVTKTCYDIFKSPPVTTLIDATVAVNYQTSNAIGSLPALYTMWAPTSWATITAKFWAWNAHPRSIVESLAGYLSTDASPLTFHGGTPATGYQECCLGERVYGLTSSSPQPYYLMVTGGPDSPAGAKLVLVARLEPAFVSNTGTQYYRRTLIYAIPPAQPALPV
jgi:hypothetical protein